MNVIYYSLVGTYITYVYQNAIINLTTKHNTDIYLR